jgi:peptidyl-prolyl cis-trans isomerase A (cyclophilin A)
MCCDLRWGAALVLSGLLGLLSACGGSGFSPAVTGVQVQTLQYGRTASIYVGGNDLRSTMVADLGPGCTSPAFSSSSSSTTLALLTCTVTAVGTLPLTIKSAEGQVLYQTSLTVPKPQVTLTTSAGSITMELDPVAAPVTVNNFLGYVNAGFYSNTLFHRVIPNFMVQGGGFTTGMVAKTDLNAPIALESNNGLRNTRGTVAMARTSLPNSATSQFFINTVDNAFLDYSSSNSGYAVFATVLTGMDVVDAIAAVTTQTVGLNENVPVTDVTITQAKQVK